MSRAARELLIYQLVLFALRSALALAVELSPDEAYYWLWSRSLSFWYFDHPPLVAWLIRLTTLGSASEYLVRLPAILCAHGTSLAIYATLRGVVERPRDALLGCGLLDLSLLGLVGGVIVTPDSPFALATALVILAGQRIAGAPTPRRWIALGLALGLAGLAKYAAALLLPPIVAWIILTPPLRHELRRPWPWLAALVGLALVIPTLLGELAHDFAGFRFQGARALHSGGHFAESLGAYVGGQIALLGPPLAYVLVRLVVTARRGRAMDLTDTATPARATLRLAAALALFVWGYLLLRSLGGFVEPNWAAPAYIAALPLIVRELGSPGWGARRLRTVVIGYTLVVAALVVVVSFAPRLPLPCRLDPTARVRGWRARVAAIEQETSPLPLLVRRYQVAAIVLFYARRDTTRRLVSAPLGWRHSQLDFWPRFRPGGGNYRLLDSARPTIEQLGPRVRSLSEWQPATPDALRCPAWFAREVWLPPLSSR